MFKKVFKEQKKYKHKRKWAKAKIKFRKIRIEEAKNRRKLIWEEVNNSKDMENFWKATNNFRKKRLGESGGIEAERFVNHFSKLLGREGERSRNQELRDIGLDTEVNEDDTEEINETYHSKHTKITLIL